MYILVLIKNAVQNSSSFAPETIPAYYPNNNDSQIPFSFGDYVTAIQAKHVCQSMLPSLSFFSSAYVQSANLEISGLADKGANWQVPFIKCDSRNCHYDGEDASKFCEVFNLGVAPSSTSDTIGLNASKSFCQYIYQRYPVLEGMDFCHVFDSNSAVDNYVQSAAYGSPGNPKLAMAIVWDGTDPSVNYNYQIRLNSTNYNTPEDAGRPAVQTTPPTRQLLTSYAKDNDNNCPLLGGAPTMVPTSCTGQYMYNGALTVQRLVGDFIMEVTGSKDRGYFVSEHGVSFAYFPTRQYVQNGFYAQIAGKNENHENFSSAVFSFPLKQCCPKFFVSSFQLSRRY